MAGDAGLTLRRATTGTHCVPVVFAIGGEHLALTISAPASATADDLARALAGGELDPTRFGVVIDGRTVDGDCPLSATPLRAGSRVELRDGRAPVDGFRSAAPSTDPAALLKVVGGLDAGKVAMLGLGRYVIGRAVDADVVIGAPTVSATHAVIEIDHGRATIADAESMNGTRVDDRWATEPTAVGPDAVVDLGAVQVRIECVATATPPRSAGPFNRPPRGAPPLAEPPLVAPHAPLAAPARPRLSWTAIALPLVMGAAMALLWDPRMAAFALFSPVFAIGSWIEERRRAGRDRRAGAQQLDADLARFAADIEAAVERERGRRELLAPDPASLQVVATLDDPRLWARRLDHDDAYVFRIGTGSEPYRPPLRDERTLAPEAARAISERGRLDRAAILVELSPGSTLGIVAADPEAATSVARHVAVQAATLIGPADVTIAVLTDDSGRDRWRFAAWLPHTAGLGEAAAGIQLLAAAPSDVDIVVAALAATRDRVRLIVADAPGLTTGRDAPLRPLLAGRAGPVVGIVTASSRVDLPASCTHVMSIDEHGVAQLDEASGRHTGRFLATGLALDVAERMALALARVDDPETSDATSTLPADVHAVDVLDMAVDAAAIADRWRSTDPAGRGLPALIGLQADGALDVDLVVDGPHALIAGTTGAGKSELLRTLVASLAMRVAPDQLNLVLIDYKGGSAFDVCAQLPHTVGIVTDLDEHLGERALRSLEAELRHRERVLRDASAIDIAQLDALRPHEPLPRLLVVIDEFATLAAELPDFVDALVGIAQRGRSLGIHLVLATQRPGGAVKENIRANTNLRIALRVQDVADSNDVLGVPDAAAITRHRPGRGLVRRGPGDVVAFQAGRVTTAATASDEVGVIVEPLSFQPRPRPIADTQPQHRRGRDLDAIVDATRRAADVLGIAPPRRPWLDPLATDIALSTLPTDAIGTVDDPDAQIQRPLVWDGDNAVVYGTRGSGKTTTLETMAFSIARRYAPAEAHVYALDFGAGRLAALADLAHVGAVVGTTETDRQHRLVRQLRTELDRRLAGAGSGSRRPKIVLLLDGWSAFSAAFDSVDGMEVRDHLTRIIADGPAVGITTVITAEQVNVVPMAIAAVIPRKLVLALTDRHEWSAFGVGSRAIPASAAGRGIDAASGLEIQIARPDGDVRAHLRTGPREAPPVAVLPARVALTTVAGGVYEGDRWSINVGIADSTLGPASLVFHPADHAVIAGPARSGRSTALVALAVSARESRPDAAINVIATRPSPAREAEADRVATTIAQAAALLDAARRDARPQLVLIDDADAFDESGIATLLQAMRPDVHVVAAARVDALRAGYGHWTRELRRSRLGIALAPQPEDGDLFGAVFSRRMVPPPLPGRGLLVVDGQAQILQVAHR